MMKKIIVALVILVAVLGLGFATIGNTAKKNTTNNTTSPATQQIVTNTNNTTDNSTNTNITSAEAQKIASKYIAVSGAIAGTPTLTKQNNKLVYIVPVIDNGKNVGEIDIDAQTGENLGGAGGAP
ncbi:PepSY domain-containing protein [Methanobacterium spitsbergense]|uniref:PepSY domain-containing protein n=1 Tax=Methanobacterium spitsbergense TaxID=2874285 RepID=A0A8T5V0J9_9EURY|nr:PepSY domain-containing protein [Methanobacterium spitsbergense]MBZ2165371.1 PepSY domain-containing protein [Methanobacterium spitsbergense]